MLFFANTNGYNVMEFREFYINIMECLILNNLTLFHDEYNTREKLQFIPINTINK